MNKRITSPKQLLLITFTIALISLFSCTTKENSKADKYGTFSFTNEIRLPGTPEYIFDKITGDISPWWDHSFSENPYKFYIEARPGGSFYELFDSLGNGVKHAEVIVANRGKMLRFDGPLGLSGQATQTVTTYQFDSIGTDSTLLKLEVRASGEVAEGIPGIVEQVWHHFLVERFKPFIEDIN